MSLEQPQQPENEETAKNALEMAGFQIGEKVAIPFPENHPTGEWKITRSTTLTIEGRELSAAIIHNPNSSSRITVTLEELCSVNPDPLYDKQFSSYNETLIPNIGEHLTDNKIIHLNKIVNGKEEKITCGKITNGAIKVGKRIETTRLNPSSTVTKITLEGNRYKITTARNGSIYYFDPSESIDNNNDNQIEEGPEIDEDLTKGKIIFFNKEKGDQKEKIIMGIINHTIKVGERIKASLLSQPTSIVTDITLEENKYKITTESGSIYYFDPSESLPALQTD
ncbi:MAG: hypothetical protein GWP15_04000 [Nitrospirae bacterium]|nr:hypothetical protein [Nitrospirota bacterium]